jgi:hypothetical protein
MMKKVISFVAWGDNPMYTHGAVYNARLANEIFPGWVSRFYLAPSVPKYIITELSGIDNTEIKLMDYEANNRSMFWRFYPASEENVDVIVSRDTDSRLSPREKAAVDEWLSSDKGFHIMRDHPYHDMPIMGGMWGAKRGTIPQMRDIIYQHLRDTESEDQDLNERYGNERYGEDQDLLALKIYPLIKDNVIVHDDYEGRWRTNVSKYQECASLPFPTPRNFDVDSHVPIFIGEQFDGTCSRLHPEYLMIL